MPAPQASPFCLSHSYISFRPCPHHLSLRVPSPHQLLYPFPHRATLTSCCEARGEKTLSSSKVTGFPLCSRWMMESSSASKVTALVASGPSPSSLVTGRTRAITRMFPGLCRGGQKGTYRLGQDQTASPLASFGVLSSLVAQEPPAF